MTDKTPAGEVLCPVALTLSLIGGKWKALILWNLLEGSDIRPTDFEKADRELFTKLLAGVLDRHAEVADAIARHADRELSRISLVERAVLMIGTYELMACPETPWRVILNESIELVKQFGSGYRFTNAVLELVAREVRPEETAAPRA